MRRAHGTTRDISVSSRKRSHYSASVCRVRLSYQRRGNKSPRHAIDFQEVTNILESTERLLTPRGNKLTLQSHGGRRLTHKKGMLCRVSAVGLLLTCLQQAQVGGPGSRDQQHCSQNVGLGSEPEGVPQGRRVYIPHRTACRHEAAALQFHISTVSKYRSIDVSLSTRPYRMSCTCALRHIVAPRSVQ